MKIVDRFNRLYDFYTSDLSYKEIEKLIKRDLPELYNFYVDKMKRPERSKKSLRGLLSFMRNLFVEFLLQLTPVRRLVYTIALILFVYGFFTNQLQLLWFGFILINLLLAFELADKLIAKDELGVAREIQTSLMPKDPPANQYFEISCYSEAAREVGGDYYDFIIQDSSPDKTYIVIGDISGKGMAAALHMVQVQAILHYLVTHNDSPKTILTLLNKNLKRILRRGSFFTVNLARLNSNGSLLLSRAGHMPLIRYCSKEKKCFNIIPRGMGIGLSQDSIFENSLEEIEIKPESGDILIFYTDGVVEAMNGFLQEYGEERFMNVITRSADKPAKTIQESILENISAFVDSSPSHDDLTLIVMKAI